MLRVFLIRPGSTDFDQQHRIQGTLNVPLNRQGNGEVAKLAGELENRGIEAIYYSDGQPAHQTADALAQSLKAKLKKLDNMHNLNQGLWQGMRVEEVKRKHPKVFRRFQEQPEDVCPPDGETVEAAKNRVQSALRKLLKRHKDGTVALVVPEPLARLVRSRLKDCDLKNLWNPDHDHSRWELIEVHQA